MPSMFDFPTKKKVKRVTKKSAPSTKTKELKQVKSLLTTTRRKLVRVKKFVDKVL